MNHEVYMGKCLELALKGQGTVAPNPLVGAIIVHNNIIIGEGFHEHFGEAHAEVNAISSVKDKSLLKDSTIYVNLEPCSHFGKTPPCSDLIIRSEIPHVVIGAIDDNEKVAGKGIEKLKKAGVKVEINILKKECIELNKRFYKFHNKGLPFVILKWAESSDGFISRTKEDVLNGKKNWITGEESQLFVHKQRAMEQAILIGVNTAIYDNPALTTRLVDGNSPLRVIVCTEPLKDYSLKILNDQNPTLIFNRKLDDKLKNKEWVKFDGDLKTVLKELVKRGVQSVLIEGGSNILNQFISLNLWDEAYNFIGDVKFNDGKIAPKINITPKYYNQIGKDKLVIYINK